jgi:SAM-dependent methyltransferase
MSTTHLQCPICNFSAHLYDVVDLNKSCAEAMGIHLPISGEPIYYAYCQACGFCYAPTMCAWSLDTFRQKIYNQDYAAIDPDYIEKRPSHNANWLVKLFKDLPKEIQHLDYGGGNGMLSDLLKQAGWDSVSYDPFNLTDTPMQQLGKFDLLTAFEVFEHVPDVEVLMHQLCSLLNENGLIIFSTLVSDGHILPHQRLTWWYASPRNGHISLFSNKALQLCAQKFQFNLASFNDGLHIMFRDQPVWANHLFESS